MLAARRHNFSCLKKLYILGADMNLTNRSNCEVVDFLADHDEQLKNLLQKVESATLQIDDNGNIEIMLGNLVYPLEYHH